MGNICLGEILPILVENEAIVFIANLSNSCHKLSSAGTGATKQIFCFEMGCKFYLSGVQANSTVFV